MLNVLVTFYAKCARALTFQTVSKETYYRVKRDLLQSQKRPMFCSRALTFQNFWHKFCTSSLCSDAVNVVME